MKVIISCDSITPCMTGIGRYSYELIRNLNHLLPASSLRRFSLGGWKSQEDIEKIVLQTHSRPQENLRNFLAKKPLAVRIFEEISPVFFSWKLRNEAGSIFHATNYFVPPFPGKAIATIHDLSHIYYPKTHPKARVEYMKRALPKSLSRTQQIITVSESVRKEVIDYFSWPESKIKKISLGVSPIFHPKSKNEISHILKKYNLFYSSYVLSIGTIEPRKNIDRLISAYDRLPSTIKKQTPLILVGSFGWESEETHKRIKKYEQAGWLCYINYASQEDLPALYAGAKLFAYPSLYEGFGLPPLEAMASGIPVITSNRSSLPEVVGDAALTLHPEDDLALTEALKKGLEDKTWRNTAIARGIQRAAQFSWSRCAAETAALYQEISAS